MPRKTPDEMRAEAAAISALPGHKPEDRRDALQWETAAEQAEYTEALITVMNQLVASVNLLSRFIRERLPGAKTKSVRKRA